MKRLKHWEVEDTLMTFRLKEDNGVNWCIMVEANWPDGTTFKCAWAWGPFREELCLKTWEELDFDWANKWYFRLSDWRPKKPKKTYLERQAEVERMQTNYRAN